MSLQFIQADSSQAEARVVFKLADDEEALYQIDHHDYHALTASWFFGKDEAAYSKKVLGYEHPIRFVGKTLRHAGHLGAGKRRAAISVNTDARKFKIPIKIDEREAENALKIFHARQPKIRSIFHAGIIECLRNNNRRLAAGIPYGINCRVGGIRTFFERWGDELFRQAFSYIPQRTVSENTKAAGLRIKKRINHIKTYMEAHDSFLFSLDTRDIMDASGIIKEEFERPIRLDTCSLARTSLIIPCELEVGENYRELGKYKDIPLIAKERIELFTNQPVPDVEIPKDTKKDTMIYRATI